MTSLATNNIPHQKELGMRLLETRREHLAQCEPTPLSPTLARIYGSDSLNFFPAPDDRPFTFVNILMSREGIFNLKDAPGGAPISQGNRADAFTMALLRSSADAIMVGANTLRSEPQHVWISDYIFENYPHMKGQDILKNELNRWRGELKGYLNPAPVFFMTNSGEIPTEAAALHDARANTYVVTSENGALRARTLIRNTRTGILVYGKDELDQRAMMKSLRKDFGIKILLHEGGRTVIDGLMRLALIDQIFLTHMNVSPIGNLQAKNVQYLFGSNGHRIPASAQLISSRQDGTGRANFLSLDVRELRCL